MACISPRHPKQVSVSGQHRIGECFTSARLLWNFPVHSHIVSRFQDAITSPITQLAWSPSANLLAWTDADGCLTHWTKPIPLDAISPTAEVVTTTAAPLPPPKKRAATPTLPLWEDVDEDTQSTQRKDVDRKDASTNVSQRFPGSPLGVLPNMKVAEPVERTPKLGFESRPAYS